jgi:hypothetical protein
MCGIEKGYQVCFQRATVQVVANGVSLNVFILSG